jgi:hypothetical protein
MSEIGAGEFGFGVSSPHKSQAAAFPLYFFINIT